MKLLSVQQEDLYILLDDILEAISYFKFLYSYIIINRYTKTNKKHIIPKLILIFNCNKEYVINNWYKIDISIQKRDYYCNIIAVIKDEK